MHFPGKGGSVTETEAENVQLVAAGSPPDFVVHLHFLFHITINPDGTVTSYIDTLTATCGC